MLPCAVTPSVSFAAASAAAALDVGVAVLPAFTLRRVGVSFVKFPQNFLCCAAALPCSAAELRCCVVVLPFEWLRGT